MFRSKKMAKFRSVRTGYVKDYLWQSRLRVMLAWIIEIIIVVAVAFGVVYYFGRQVTVTDDSMEPTLSVQEKLLVNSAATTFLNPKRGDIIAFRSGNDENSAILIKRIIGLPGETVQIVGGQIYINDSLYVEDRGFPAITNPGLAESKIKLGGTEYFVLGDSRNNSEDSRHVDIGNVDKERIIGKVWAKLNPFSVIK